MPARNGATLTDGRRAFPATRPAIDVFFAERVRPGQRTTSPQSRPATDAPRRMTEIGAAIAFPQGQATAADLANFATGRMEVMMFEEVGV